MCDHGQQGEAIQAVDSEERPVTPFIIDDAVQETIMGSNYYE
jgi:hypothetical protein